MGWPLFLPCVLADTISVPLNDSSFEDNPVAAGATSTNGINLNFDMGADPYWSEAGTTFPGDDAQIWQPTSTSFLSAGNLASPASGSQCLLLMGGSDNTTAVYQYVPLPGGIQLGATYTVTLAIGSPKDFLHGGYSIVLADAGADEFAYINDDTTGKVPQETGLFYTKSLSFTGAYVAENYPDALGEAGIYIALAGDGGTGPNGAGTVYDNVQLTASGVTVPEPSTLALLAAGALGLLAYAWRKGGK